MFLISLSVAEATVMGGSVADTLASRSSFLVTGEIVVVASIEESFVLSSLSVMGESVAEELIVEVSVSLLSLLLVGAFVV